MLTTENDYRMLDLVGLTIKNKKVITKNSIRGVL